MVSFKSIVLYIYYTLIRHLAGEGLPEKCRLIYVYVFQTLKLDKCLQVSNKSLIFAPEINNKTIGEPVAKASPKGMGKEL
jgi:hypothetical protein